MTSIDESRRKAKSAPYKIHATKTSVKIDRRKTRYYRRTFCDFSESLRKRINVCNSIGREVANVIRTYFLSIGLS